MKLAEHFYQVGGDKLSHPDDATSYLIDGGSEGLYLVDCGTPDGYQAILSNIRSLGFRPESIKAILGTHGHYDHVGSAYLWQEEFSIPLYLHEADKERVETADGIQTTAQLLYGKDFPAVGVKKLLEDGQSFKLDKGSIEVIHTPGHTPGGVCFIVHLSGLSILLAGDTLWGGFSREILSDEEDWKKSLLKLQDYDYDLLSFGHTGPCLYGEAKARVEEAYRQFAVYYNPWFKPMKESFRF
jgi:glyoxylase-like metal-dependent hydrolase (beta-lactamase superfamily II)